MPCVRRVERRPNLTALQLTPNNWPASREAAGRLSSARPRYSLTFEGMAIATTLDSFWRFDSAGFS